MCPIDMLILNAGVLFRELRQIRGLEMQFVVNHLGHFILGNRLMDRVVDAPEGRVVVVGSIAHRRVPEGGIQFDNLTGEGWSGQAYGHSKLANGLYSLELSKRLAGTRATSNSVHPGGVRTNILRNVSPRAIHRWQDTGAGRRDAMLRGGASGPGGAFRAATLPTAIPPARASTRQTRRWRRACGKYPKNSLAAISSRSLRRRNSRKRKFAIAVPSVDRLRSISGHIGRNRSAEGADESGFAAVNSYGADS